MNSGPEDCEEMLEPVDNKLYFAGEAYYSQSIGTVHGAFITGII